MIGNLAWIRENMKIFYSMTMRYVSETSVAKVKMKKLFHYFADSLIAFFPRERTDVQYSFCEKNNSS